MADAPASTPPQQQQQEQPTRPASFEATWDQQDASFLQPGAIPLPKAHRAWERQPQSPFARNSRYRKVWKRYDLRSQPKTKLSAAEMNKKSPAKSPRKVVKKRALDAPLDPNATPGKKGPKNKAFAPTQWETPRRNSGRIASRKIAQPIFIEEPRPITAQTEMSTPVTEDDIPKWSRAEGAEKNVSWHNNLEVGAIIEENKDSVETDKQSVPQVENAAEVLHSELAQGQREKTPPAAEISPEVMVVEEDEVSELQESPEQPQTENADPDVDTSPSEVVAGVELNETSEDLVEEHGSVDSNPTESEAVKSCSVVEEDDQAQLAKDISVDPRHFGALSEEQEGSGNMSEQSYGEEVEHREADLEASKSSNSLSGEDEPVDTFEKATLHGFEDSKANQGACMNEDQDPTASEKQPSELPANDLGETKQVDGVIAQHLTVTEAAEELLDTTMEGGEEQAQAGASATEAVVQESIAPLKEEKPIDAEHRLQADATLVAIPDPTLEKDERSSTSSVSDDGMDEAEQLDEDEYTLTELPEGGEGEVEDDATSIPSPSLSAAESPRFSSVADTLTLNLPDRTPPKNRTTKELPEEPASPIDEDTAFLKDFLSRADASKASREAATSRPESITNRRNSDIIRLALSSPRVALETKDPNFSSTSNANPLDQKAMPKESDSSSTASVTAVMKLDFSDLTSDLTLEKSSTSGSPSPAPQPPTEPPSSKPPQPPTTTARRSARQTRQTRLPATPSASSAGPNRITLLRGAEPIVLKKSEAQELTALTRNNTRRNKGAALAAPIRLNKLKAEALKASAATSAEGKEAEEQVPVRRRRTDWQD
ncbi:hypothetical protein MPH_09865 [Macrophomina phaseolina MS6]|uniref:Uncharacterized protein n=1 Tax=Macrophomina phaseolina (strain MS6) TaxID=1126212 RepID=K2S865_MACPH|nr:hypothetical protein MPH_09865 [Macrophomina phaseolina MS6]